MLLYINHFLLGFPISIGLIKIGQFYPVITEYGIYRRIDKNYILYW
jgi:hypothetical protein